MGAEVVLGLAAAGLVVGFVAGLVGIGGGVLMVPLLYLFYGHPEWSGTWVSPALEPAVAHATSLFVIMPTALLGVSTYGRAGLVPWRLVLPVALGSTLGAVAGAQIAMAVPGAVLKLAFGLLVLASGVQLAVGRRSAAELPLRAGCALLVGIGLLVGLISALLGVGGGVIAIPLLAHVVRLDLQRVTGVSLGVVAFAALAGTASYVAGGAGVEGLPPGSLGYVHLWAALPLLVGSLPSVGWGARVNRQLGVGRLRWVFGAAFLIIGMKLVVENSWVLFQT
ncbi:MAG TPA: sulfite exporter TauE/SafE family protein [Longimicrobiales bacterium]